MKSDTLVLMSLALLALMAAPAGAEDMNVIMPMDSEATLPSYSGKGTVHSVDVKAGKLDLKLEPIADLGWSAKTMAFKVRDRDTLSRLQPGQRITFELIEIGPGKYTVSQISPVK